MLGMAGMAGFGRVSEPEIGFLHVISADPQITGGHDNSEMPCKWVTGQKFLSEHGRD